MALRRNLPSATPFFDVCTMRNTPQGNKVPHLIVRCGTNHVDTLTDILSEYLDGGTNTTALFMGRKLLMSMSHEESEQIYETHQLYVQSIQRLPLYPGVINIDRIRTEYPQDGPKIERSTRDWVSTLQTENGDPMKCDVENGGHDKRAYLLAPSSMLSVAKTALATYKLNLRPSDSYSSTTTNNGDTNNRPTEIYIPTAAVLRNLQAMQKMQASSADIWRAAPPSVTTATSDSHPIPFSNTNRYARRAAAFSPLEQRARNNLPTAGKHHQTNDNHSKSNQVEFPSLTRQPSITDSTTVGTTQSPLTRNTGMNNTQMSENLRKFEEMEAAFLKKPRRNREGNRPYGHS